MAREAELIEQETSLEVVLDNLNTTTMATIQRHQRMPARHFFFRLLVFSFWITIALNIYLLTSAIMEWYWALIVSIGPIMLFLILSITFELATSRIEIEGSVDEDAFRAWEFGALYTRTYELTVRATVKDVDFLKDPFTTTFDIWIGETTPRVPDGDDLDTLSLVEVKGFILKGPSALSLRFDEAPPLYLWKGNCVDSHIEIPHQIVFTQRIQIPNGMWWIGIANRALDHPLEITIDLSPVWTSFKSWVLPLEGREYACHM